MFPRSRNRVSPTFVAPVLLSLVAVGSAIANNANPIVSVTVWLSHPVTMAGKHLMAGTYSVKADDSRVALSLDGKVVVEAPVRWKDEQNKPKMSSVVTSRDRLTEIHFGGRMRYIEIVE
jgi:hypothetical protein